MATSSKSKTSTKKKPTAKPKAKSVTYDDLYQARLAIQQAEEARDLARRRYRRAQAQDEVALKSAMLSEAGPALEAAQAAVGAALADFEKLRATARSQRG